MAAEAEAGNICPMWEVGAGEGPVRRLEEEEEVEEGRGPRRWDRRLPRLVRREGAAAAGALSKNLVTDTKRATNLSE